jgi:hypothetical protein
VCFLPWLSRRRGNLGEPSGDFRDGQRFRLVLIPEDAVGSLEIFDSLAAANGHIPDDIFGEAEITAGVRKRDDYPEEPWEL